MDGHPLVCYGDHHSLANALSRRDIDSFRRVLHSPTEVEKFEAETSMTIFEQACQTPGCAQFIEECILAGCDVNKLNPELNKRPIHFVVESHNEDNLAALLRDPSVDVNSRCSMFNTPVNTLAEQISDENFRRVFPCIKLLIQHGADVNLPNKREITPVTNILKNRQLNTANKEVLVKYLLQNVVEVDLDTYRNGEARALLQKTLPDIPIAPINANHKENDNTTALPSHRLWDFNRLYLALKNEKEDEFLIGLQQVSEKSPQALSALFTAAEHRETLLIAAISKNLPIATQKLIDMGADVNYFAPDTVDSFPPVKCAVIRGHWKELEILLKSPELDINSAPLLPIVVRNLGQPTSSGVDFEKCFQILLRHRNIDINQVDAANCSALHYAVKFNNSKAILELLSKGAYIGTKSKFNQLAISNINPKVLEKHFDSCITTNGFRISDDNFEIEFDYKNFIPHQTDPNDESFANEITAIEYLSTSKEHRQLIMHPLIGSLLTLKWSRLAIFFYINFFLCSLFAVATVAYILIYYNSKRSDSFEESLATIIFILTIYIAAREMLQFLYSPRIYVACLENYLECTLVVLIMLILFDVCSDSWRRIFAASTILLIAIEIFLLAGSLPFWSFSCHYVMLRTVTWSFLRSLSLYAIILLAFALSFFCLLHESTENNGKKSVPGNENNDDEDSDDFNKFSSVGLSIMKTLVMATGEFDFGSINFKLNSFSYVIFITFLFIVSIVLLNLLNGLAVSDTQAIKSEAELTNFIRRSQVLARYDGVLGYSFPSFMRFCCIGSKFDELKSIYHIRVKPNDNNQILIPDLNTHEDASDMSDNLRPLRCIHIFTCSDPCARMDAKIVKLSFSVLEKNAHADQDENEREQLNKRMTKMETTLQSILDKLNELTKK